MTIHFETLGCRLNQDETEGAARSFSNAGFATDLDSVTAKTPESSEVVLSVINTCTVTGKAEQKARRIIRLLLEKFPKAPVVVTGCYAELDGSIIKEISPDRIAIVKGTQKFVLSLLPAYLKKTGKFNSADIQKFIDESSSGEAKDDIKKSPFLLYTPIFERHTRASIKIEDGCNNNCSFCRIHLARGKAVSLDPETVLERIKELESKGFYEVVFTGVNLSQYAGKSKEGKIFSFKMLLDYLLENTGIIKFRVSSFYPQHITEDLCQVLKSPRVQPSFHLSIQSGSDYILERMARPYNADSVMNAVRLLRQAKDSPFISCDIIAGFPGESEEDFEMTKKLCEKCQFSWIHAFPFSPRPGTAAYSMKPQIPERIKGDRVKILTETAIQGKICYIEKFSGTVLNAVVENSRAQRLGIVRNVYHAVTDNFLHVEFQSQDFIEQGRVVKIKITEVLEENIRSGMEIVCRGSLA